MPESQTDGLLDQLDDRELSSLLALRVLASHDVVGAWIPGAALAEALPDEFARLSTLPGVGPGRVTPPAALFAHPSEDAAQYVRQQIVPQLVNSDVVEARETGEGELWVRLTPEVQAAEPELQRRIDARIAQMVRAPEEPATVTGSAVAAQPGHDTLSAEGLVKIYRKRRVVNDVALHVSQGEIVGLLGPNGAGKTTTFYMMVGLIAPDHGRVTIGKEDVSNVPMYRRARKGIGYLAQEPSIFRKLTVEENVRAILQMMKLPKREQDRRLEELLDELGIKHLRHSKAYALSGGERRRLEITRALVGQPKFMLLDEPFAGVDPIAVHDIQQIVADLRRRNIGVLISDHNVEQTLDIVDRAYIMYDGRVRISGTVSELVWNDEAAEIYLGPTLTARMRQRYTYPE
ncbi:MAG TPA: LPS export ABC transporter ATP-binding protein [Longimicrobiaceae bacterium]|nr:LPS export ABC transporter ATP-binding protein [Longimicrobiaceae bacterium]